MLLLFKMIYNNIYCVAMTSRNRAKKITNLAVSYRTERQLESYTSSKTGENFTKILIYNLISQIIVRQCLYYNINFNLVDNDIFLSCKFV